MTVPTTTVTAIDVLGAVHGHHVATIEAVQAAQSTGAIVVLDGPGEGFFTGITSGDTVAVTDATVYPSSTSRTVQRLDADGAHLSVNSGMTLTAVPTHEWTIEMAHAAKAAAEKGAQALMDRAVDTVARGNDEQALTFLRQANDLRGYAFAVGVLLDFIFGLATNDPYVMGHAKRVVA